MNKKALIILAAMLTLSLTACGGKTADATTTAPTETTTARSDGTVSALAAEPTIETAVSEEDSGEPGIYFEGTENTVNKEPPNITVCMDDGEVATAGICRPLGFSWSYADGELMCSVESDTMVPSEMFDLDELARFSYSDTQGTVEVQLPANAELTGVYRWTREQSYNAVYSGNVITLENDGNEYIYEMRVTYPENPAGGGNSNYCFIMK